jgi:serine protease Do
MFALAVAAPAAVAGPQAPEPALPSIAPLVDSVKAAVVNVDVVSRSGGGEEEEEATEPFGPFFGRQFQNPHQLRKGMGSGFIIDPKGYLLTNNHVVEGATSIKVRLTDGRTLNGTVVGRDPLTDVALVKVKNGAAELPYVKLGDSDAIKVGDWVVAIGNPFGFESSVSLGIISGRARHLGMMYDDFLQTDAAINPGNSGGPLLNLKGEVVGINTAIVSGGTGVGFAVPSSLVKVLVPQMEKSGEVAHGYLGVAPQKVTADIARGLRLPVHEGALVYTVEKGSPAQRAGVQQDDVIVAVDGQKVDSDITLKRLVGFKAPGKPVKLTVYRQGHEREVTVTLTQRPETEELKKRSRHELNPDEESSRQAIGMKIMDMNPRLAQRAGLPAEGAVITDVTPGSAAESAELAPGMVVVEANHKPVHGADELLSVIRATKPGADIVMRVEFRDSHGAQVRVLQKPS